MTQCPDESLDEILSHSLSTFGSVCMAAGEITRVMREEPDPVKEQLAEPLTKLRPIRSNPRRPKPMRRPTDGFPGWPGCSFPPGTGCRRKRRKKDLAT
jgi:hypothetical protein